MGRFIPKQDESALGLYTGLFTLTEQEKEQLCSNFLDEDIYFQAEAFEAEESLKLIKQYEAERASNNAPPVGGGGTNFSEIADIIIVSLSVIDFKVLISWATSGAFWDIFKIVIQKAVNGLKGRVKKTGKRETAQISIRANQLNSEGDVDRFLEISINSEMSPEQITQLVQTAFASFNPSYKTDPSTHQPSEVNL